MNKARASNQGQQGTQIELWKAESVRLTAFPMPPFSPEKVTWWTDMAGLPPETQVSQPRIGGLKEEGAWEQGRLCLEMQPNRIDWHFLPVVTDDAGEKGVPVIGPFPDAVLKFIDMGRRWLAAPTTPKIQRLAFGAVLLQPVPDRKSGYMKMANYLKGSVTVDVDHSSDLTYSINRPRPSGAGVPKLDVNRLSKWSVMIWSRLLHIIPLTTTVDRKCTTGSQWYTCRLELDISTAADFPEPMPLDKLEPVWDELVDLGKEIAEQGDIA